MKNEDANRAAKEAVISNLLVRLHKVVPSAYNCYLKRKVYNKWQSEWDHLQDKLSQIKSTIKPGVFLKFDRFFFSILLCINRHIIQFI